VFRRSSSENQNAKGLGFEAHQFVPKYPFASHLTTIAGSTDGGTRTPNFSLLRRVPLPIGLHPHEFGRGRGSRTLFARVMSPARHLGSPHCIAWSKKELNLQPSVYQTDALTVAPLLQTVWSQSLATGFLRRIARSAPGSPAERDGHSRLARTPASTPGTRRTLTSR
jgi:hypothetical protein